jgi:hypothetical protein
MPWDDRAFPDKNALPLPCAGDKRSARMRKLKEMIRRFLKSNQRLALA